MRDHQHGAVGRAQRIDAFGHQLQRIDVEAGIGFVEDGELRLEQRHLENLQPLLLAAGEADIERALQHLFADLQRGGLLAHQLEHAHGVEFAFAARAALGVERGLEEVHAW